jgi:hypothetical protein
MPLLTTAKIQDATTISLTETDLSDEINVGRYERLNLYIKYTKGDEDGVFITPYDLIETEGERFQFQQWDAAAGSKARTVSDFSLTASGNYLISLDVFATKFIVFTQDADNGTPTGTIEAWYSIAAGSAN